MPDKRACNHLTLELDLHTHWLATPESHSPLPMSAAGPSSVSQDVGQPRTRVPCSQADPKRKKRIEQLCSAPSSRLSNQLHGREVRSGLYTQVSWKHGERRMEVPIQRTVYRLANNTDAHIKTRTHSKQTWCLEFQNYMLMTTFYFQVALDCLPNSFTSLSHWRDERERKEGKREGYWENILLF